MTVTHCPSTDSITLGKLRLDRKSCGGITDVFGITISRTRSRTFVGGDTAYNEDFQSSCTPRNSLAMHEKSRTASEQVEFLIEHNPILLFSLACCPLSKQAKAALAQSTNVFMVVELAAVLIHDVKEFAKGL